MKKKKYVSPISEGILMTAVETLLSGSITVSTNNPSTVDNGEELGSRVFALGFDDDEDE